MIKKQDIIDIKRNPMHLKQFQDYNGQVESIKNQLAMDFRNRLDKVPNQFWTYPNRFTVPFEIIIDNHEQ